jgi:hypothetical protein
MFLCPQNSHVERLMTSVLVLGGGAFKRPSDHECRVLENRISALMKETPPGLPCPGDAATLCEPESEMSSGTESAGALI